MAKHARFQYKTLEELQAHSDALHTGITFQADLSPLFTPRKVGAFTAPNGFAVLPMEGGDCDASGTPGTLTTQRYRRFAQGGTGLIWWEACAVVPEGRANNRQMMLTADNLAHFTQLLQDINRDLEHPPLHILQLTHSGRYSHPGDAKAPMIAQRNPYLDALSGVTGDEHVVSDNYLESLIPKLVEGALLAKAAGFQGVDIKACNGYLYGELLGAHTRTGRYGGSFEHRTALLLETVRQVRQAVGDDFIVACRLSVFDAMPMPYGFGGDEHTPDFTEPKMLIGALIDAGVDLLGLSAGDPHYSNPQLSRPYDVPNRGIAMPDEHPLESCGRLFGFNRQCQEAAGAVPVVGLGYSWLRQFFPQAAAANLSAQGGGFVGLGRMSLAYPQAPGILQAGEPLEPKKCCLTCSRCVQMMRDYGAIRCILHRD